MARAEGPSRDERRLASRTRLREPAVRGAQLLAVSGFALAQPLFDILGKNAEFFAVRGSTPSRHRPLRARRHVRAGARPARGRARRRRSSARRAARVLHYVFLGFLAAVFGVQALKRSGVDGTVVLIVGAVAGRRRRSRVAAWRVRIARSFLTILSGASLDLPRRLPLRLEGRGARLPGRRERVAPRTSSRRRRSSTCSSTSSRVIDLLNGEGSDRREALPELRAARADVDLVPEHDHALGVDDRRGARDPHGEPAGARRAAGRAELPATTSSRCSRTHYRMNVTESQTRLCPPQICHRTGAEHRAAALVALLGRAHRLPAPRSRRPRSRSGCRRSTSRGATSAPTPADELEGEALPKVNMHTFYIGRVQDFNRFLASFERASRTTAPTLYFLHVLMPHGPWLYTPNGQRARGREPARAGPRRTSSGGAPTSRSRRGSGTCSRSATRTRCSAASSTGCEAVGLWDKALVVVDPDHGISFRGGDKRREPTTTNLSDLAFIPLFMKLPGAADRAGSSTRTSRPRTSCRRSPTCSASTSRGRRPDISVLERRPPDHPFVQVGKLTAPYAKVLAQRRRSLARQLALFGTGDVGPRFAGTGRFRGLVGKPCRDAERRGEARQPGGRRQGREQAAAQPAEGVAARPVAARRATCRTCASGGWLALALNGRIAAVSHTYGTGGKLRFSLLAGDDVVPRRAATTCGCSSSPGATAKPRLHELHVTPDARSVPPTVHVTGECRSACTTALAESFALADARRRRGRNPVAADDAGRRRAARPRRAAAPHRRELRRRRRQRRSRSGTRARRPRREHAGRADGRRLPS